MTTVFMFPGQGSQKEGMGEDLFDTYADLTKNASEYLGYCLKTLCLTDHNKQLNQTQFTQPALYVVNAFSWMKAVEEGQKADMVLGHSLGEYNALLAAGVYDFMTGLKLVEKRGALMAKAKGGGMAAILGLTQDEVKNILQEKHLETIDLANINGTHQIVISGPVTDIEASVTVFQEASAKRVLPLAVSGAFHSRYMEEAQVEFCTFLESFSYKVPQVSVIANYTAEPYADDSIVDNLKQQLTHSVRWVQSMQYVLAQGDDVSCVELGPGKVLTGLLKRIR